MARFALLPILKRSHGLLLSSMFNNRGFSFYMSGIIPGGGLGKLQGIKEEEYFSRQDHKLFENMRTNTTKQTEKEIDNCSLNEDDPLWLSRNCACSIKHKNILEEAYFLNEHCDSLQLLKDKVEDKKKESSPHLI